MNEFLFSARSVRAFSVFHGRPCREKETSFCRSYCESFLFCAFYLERGICELRNYVLCVGAHKKVSTFVLDCSSLRNQSWNLQFSGFSLFLLNIFPFFEWKWFLVSPNTPFFKFLFWWTATVWLLHQFQKKTVFVSKLLFSIFENFNPSYLGLFST